jgi:poly [ADP-ribose] polymerase 10/14/15
MYLARVLTGVYTVGRKEMRVPPARDWAVPHIVYDSLVNRPTQPYIFVIFNDTQAYPEYLITYRRR